MQAKELKYLQNKHRGGLSNAKGQDYERFYVVKEILRICADTNDLSSISFVPQAEAFVDDLKEQLPDGNVYCQLKNVEHLHWSDGNPSHTIEEDFQLQAQLCDERQEVFMLRMVYSNGDSCIKTIPCSIAAYTEVEHFRNYSSVEMMIQSESDVVARFQKCFPQFDTTDKLCNFAVSLLGVWSSADHSDSEVLLLDLVRQVDEVGHGYTALILPAGELPQDIDQLMACFDELKYGIHNGMLCLQFRSMFISVPPSEALFSRLRAANPQSIKELLSVCY